MCDTSHWDPSKTKVIGKVVRYTNILEEPIPKLLNEDDKLIDTGQITNALKLQVLKNDINATMVSWEQRVTSEDKYITMVSTVLVKAVTLLGFEYRSVHDGDHRGFTVKPTAKYIDECLDIVQLQHANAMMTPLTFDQVQHSLFRAVVGKLQYISGVRPDLMFATECLSYKLASPILADLTRAKKVLKYLEGTRELNLYLTIPTLKPNDLNKTLKHITGYSDADWDGVPVTKKSTSCTLCYVDKFLLTSECRGHLAWNAWKRCCENVDSQGEHFTGIQDRFLRDPVYRESQLAIGWTEQKCKEWGELAKYHTNSLQRKREETKDNGILL